MTDLDRVRALVSEMSERLPESTAMVCVTITTVPGTIGTDEWKGDYHVGVCDAFVGQIPRQLLLRLALEKIVMISMGEHPVTVDSPRRRPQ